MQGYEHRLRAGIDPGPEPGPANAGRQEGGQQKDLSREGLGRQPGAPGVQRMLDQLRRGDTVIVWKAVNLDHLITAEDRLRVAMARQ